MSKYTTEVRFICENAVGLTESVGYKRVDEIIDMAIPKVFSFDFPIFDEAYRNVLCKKILKHYYTREICEETVGLWQLRLDTRMNEIMPYYNKLYQSELLEFNPLYDTDLTRKSNKENNAIDTENLDSTRDVAGDSETDSTSDTTASATANHDRTERDLYSETPQGALTNVENEEYLTNARKKLGSETEQNNGTSNQVDNSITNYKSKDKFNSNQVKNAESTEDYLETVVGKQGGASYSKMLMEYRDTFLNIDMQVIESLSDLFFGLW